MANLLTIDGPLSDSRLGDHGLPEPLASGRGLQDGPLTNISPLRDAPLGTPSPLQDGSGAGRSSALVDGPLTDAPLI